jgi:hypothetical protein
MLAALGEVLQEPAMSVAEIRAIADGTDGMDWMDTCSDRRGDLCYDALSCRAISAGSPL